MSKLGSKKRRETLRLKQLISIEEQIRALGYQCLAGIDEVGRGPLAGPVVAAACILPSNLLLRGIKDSKQLPEDKRFYFYEKLMRNPEVYYGIGVVEAVEIDQINILQASLKAAMLAVAHLPIRPDFLLMDGNQLPNFDIPAEGIIDADRLCQVVAAASIIAKQMRDQIMIGYHALYPEYGFQKHKGYATSEHIAALHQYGPSLIHRMSFGTVKEILCEV